ncbi:MAG: hypothetical protein AB1630_04520 [bacterium]
MRDRYVFIIILAITILFFFEPLFTNKTFVYRDIHLLIYPMKIFATECIKKGFLPFWNPYILCGSPFLAQIHHQTLYPPSILVYYLPFAFGIELFVTLHVFLAGLFFYFLIKDQGLNSASSLFASLSYVFSGIFLSTGNFIITLSTATWTPLLVFFYIRALKKQSIRYAILSGIITTISFLSGTPDYLYLDILLLFFLTLTWIFYKKSLFGLKSFLILGLVGISISLFQLTPFLELVFLSNRIKGLSFSDVSLWSLGLYDMLCLFIPNGGAIPSEKYVLPYIGQQMTTSLYMGILPLILAIFAIFWEKKKSLYFWGLISIFSIILAGGKYLGLYYLFYKFLPGFSMLKDPVKALHLFSFSASILAGFGFNQIFSKDIRKGLLLFLFLFLFFSLIFKYTPILLEIMKTLNPPYRINNNEIEIWRFFVSLNCLKVAVFLLGFYILISIKKRLSLHLFYCAIIFLTLFDLWTFNSHFHYMINEEFYRKPPKVSRFIKDRKRFFHFSPSKMVFYVGPKVGYPDFVATKEILCGNIGMIFKLYAISGYESMYLFDTISFLGLPKDVLWKITGVRYIISDKFYINPHFLPRTVFTSFYKVMDRKDILRYIFCPNFNPEKEVVLEEKPKKSQESEGQRVRGKYY